MVETCDGHDNDCDGVTDDGVLNACEACGAVPPEACNGRDDNCDGVIDEGVRNACNGCGAVPDEVCNGADDDCDGETDEGVANACGGCAELPLEVCDEVDNDCDGQTDEGVLNDCGACGPIEAADPCNGVDDDCDGELDEDVLHADCAVGTGECRSEGRQVCLEAQMVCDAEAGEAAEEVCNGLDDDCDGLPDDGADLCAQAGDADRHFSALCQQACVAACTPGWYVLSEANRSCERGCDAPLDAQPVAVPHVGGLQVASVDYRGSLVVVTASQAGLRITVGQQRVVFNTALRGTWDAPSVLAVGSTLVVVARLSVDGAHSNYALRLTRNEENTWVASGLASMSTGDHGPAVLTLDGDHAVAHFIQDSAARGVWINRVHLNGDDWNRFDGVDVNAQAVSVVPGPLAVAARTGAGNATYVYLVGVQGEDFGTRLGLVTVGGVATSNHPVPSGGVSLLSAGGGAFNYAFVDNGQLQWGRINSNNDDGAPYIFGDSSTGPQGAGVQTHQLHPTGGGFVLLSTHTSGAAQRCQARFLNAALGEEAVNPSMTNGPCEVAQFAPVVTFMGPPVQQGDPFVFGLAIALQTVPHLICE